MTLPRAFGDFQTPPALAAQVWQAVDLAGADLVVEPTVGRSAFLRTVPDVATPWVAYDNRFEATRRGEPRRLLSRGGGSVC